MVAVPEFAWMHYEFEYDLNLSHEQIVVITMSRCQPSRRHLQIKEVLWWIHSVTWVIHIWKKVLIC